MKTFITLFKEYKDLKKEIKNLFFMYDNEKQMYFISIGWSPEFYRKYMFIEKII